MPEICQKDREGKRYLGKISWRETWDALRPPDFDQLVQLGGLSYQDINAINGWSTNPIFGNLELCSDLYSNRLAFGSNTGHRSGRELTIPFHDSDHKLVSIGHTTGGGIVYTADRHFYLTAGHTFENGTSLHSVDGAASDNYDFDLSETDDSDDESLL